jgi:hypothetical protein
VTIGLANTACRRRSGDPPAPALPARRTSGSRARLPNRPAPSRRTTSPWSWRARDMRSAAAFGQVVGRAGPSAWSGPRTRANGAPAAPT